MIGRLPNPIDLEANQIVGNLVHVVGDTITRLLGNGAVILFEGLDSAEDRVYGGLGKIANFFYERNNVPWKVE